MEGTMNIRIQCAGSVLCALLVCTPFFAHASPVLRSGESVTVSDTQEVPDDFYAVGGTVMIAGKVKGDLYAAAETVIVDGDIAQDAVIAGGSVYLNGSVGDDVRLLGGDLTIADTVEGDVLVMGGVVHILPTAKIKGDLLFFGGELDMEGDVRGSLSGRAKRVRVNGPVLGTVSVTTSQALELGDQAHVEGAIIYASMQDISRAPGSVVIGDITKKELFDTSSGVSVSYILGLLALFFTTLVYLLVCKKKIERLMRHTFGAFIRHGLIGLGVLVLMPIVAALLLVSAIGFAVGTALLLLYALLLVVTASLLGIFAGALLSRYFADEIVLTLKWALLGTVAVAIMVQIPYVGVLVAIIADVSILGGIATFLYARIRE